MPTTRPCSPVAHQVNHCDQGGMARPTPLGPLDHAVSRKYPAVLVVPASPRLGPCDLRPVGSPAGHRVHHGRRRDPARPHDFKRQRYRRQRLRRRDPAHGPLLCLEQSRDRHPDHCVCLRHRQHGQSRAMGQPRVATASVSETTAAVPPISPSARSSTTSAVACSAAHLQTTRSSGCSRTATDRRTSSTARPTRPVQRPRQISAVNYHLTAASPCVNAGGATCPPDDIDDDTRPIGIRLRLRRGRIPRSN
jgi:hypothetical protein